MRRPLKLVVTFVAILVSLIFIRLKMWVIWDQNSVLQYLRSSADNGLDDINFVDNSTTGKIVVMAKTTGADTGWVEEYLPDWQTAIYTVDDPNAALRTPANKGHESMAYLTYIIDHYDTLPSIVVFLHPHRDGFFAAWHTDVRNHNNIGALVHLRLDHIKRMGYVNLRCNWNPGCLDGHREKAIITPEIWRDLFGPLAKKPALIAAPCCAQFAVTSEQIRQRPKEDYVRLRRWVLGTELNDAKSGRVLEYIWHIVFGQSDEHCPDENACYCNVYGRC